MRYTRKKLRKGTTSYEATGFCKALGLSAVGGLLLPAGSAVAAQPVGHAVPDGTYPLPFLSILSNLDITHDFYYSESLFDHPATEYDHQLAFVTLGMVMAAFTAAVSIPQYWVNGSVGREANLAAAYELLGFGDARFYNYDIDTGKAGDYVGYSLARKRYLHNGKTRTLVALMLRGGGYGGEWASNVHTGLHQRPLRLHDTGGRRVCLPQGLSDADRTGGRPRRAQALDRRLQPRGHHREPPCRQGAERPAAAWKRPTASSTPLPPLRP